MYVHVLPRYINDSSLSHFLGLTVIETNRFFRLVSERLKPSPLSASSLSSPESSASSFGLTSLTGSFPVGASVQPLQPPPTASVTQTGVSTSIPPQGAPATAGGPGSTPLGSGSVAATPTTGTVPVVTPATASASSVTAVDDKPTATAESTEAALIVVRYILCSELFATTVQEKTVFNLNPVTTAMKDLYGLILYQEKVDEGFTLELFSHEGYPLSANEFTSHCKYNQMPSYFPDRQGSTLFQEQDLVSIEHYVPFQKWIDAGHC